MHPLEEAQGFRALLNLEEPKYSVGQIAAKVGKTPAYVAQRVKLTELSVPVVDVYAEEIGVGHALLLAKLQPDQQEQALSQFFREEWAGNSGKSKRILLPVRHLQQWIEHSLMLILLQAPFDTRDAQLVPAAGSCLDCPKRTGHNKLLFADVRQDACTDPTCYAVKIEAHVRAIVTAKPQVVQISTGYGQQAEGGSAIPRNKYVEIRQEKPGTIEKAKWPEYKTCRYTTEAIVTQGSEKGELRKVCAQPDCPVHHPKRQQTKVDASFKAEQEKHHREEVLANATGMRVLSAIIAAVPVRLMKRDLLFTTELLLPLLDDRRVEMIARSRGIKTTAGDSTTKLLSAFLRKADESAVGRLMVEATILLSARTQQDAAKALRAAAQTYKVDADAIALKVKQEFSAKDKAKITKRVEPKSAPKAVKRMA